LPNITLPDGSVKSFPGPVTVAEVAQSIGAGLARAALAGKVDGRLVDTSHRIERDAALAIVTEWREFRSPDFAALKSRLASAVIFDGRNLYDPPYLARLGIKYYGVGRGQRIEIGQGRQRVSARQSLLSYRMVSKMDQQADETRDQTASVFTLQGKRRHNDYDVFISYNRDNRAEVLDIAESLTERGILPWLDAWEGFNGSMTPQKLAPELAKCKTLASSRNRPVVPTM